MHEDCHVLATWVLAELGLGIESLLPLALALSHRRARRAVLQRRRGGPPTRPRPPTQCSPWARGHGLAKVLLEAAEKGAREAGLSVMRLDVRATQTRAIALYEGCHYRRWGTLQKYHMVDGQLVAGYFYVKDLL